MPKIRSLLVILIIFPLLSACVARVQYLQVENDLVDTQKQLEEVWEELNVIEGRLQESEKRRTDCFKDMQEYQKKCQELEKTNVKLLADANDLKNINTRLSREVEDLKIDMEKRNSIIQIQERVIGLLDDTKKTIETSLKKQIATELIKIEKGKGTLRVSFTDKILFDSGSVTIREEGKKLLLKMAASVKNTKEQNIVVEGHTDNVPTGPTIRERFPTNWELSAARALAVVRFLQEQALLNPEKLSACAYSSYRPLTSNDSEKGRGKNRRIEIILTPAN
ncbi:MAG: OmpA family protein [Thermodesulfobacteriota bacterium]|nr:OmpA family protein [Thermodesulfobacteriota bacterium]